jgi:hypothetical protein
MFQTNQMFQAEELYRMRHAKLIEHLATEATGASGTSEARSLAFSYNLAARHLTPGITRPLWPSVKHDKLRVAGRVHAVVMLRRPRALAPPDRTLQPEHLRGS